MEIREFYADHMRLSVGSYGVSLTFGLSEAHPAQGGLDAPAEEQARVRVSLEMAKMIAMMLRHQLKSHERNGGRIAIPSSVFTQIGIAEEDW
mgnify:CR=1 FL=1